MGIIRACLQSEANINIATYFVNFKSALDKESIDGLSQLTDDTQQHLASLNTLGVNVSSEVVVYIIKSKLPSATLEKWETSLERNEFPSLESNEFPSLYEFLYKTAVCASKREKSKLSESEKGKGEPPTKKKRGHPSNQAFISNASRNCIACNIKRHPLYVCDKFKQLSVPKCIETVKNAKLCYNCLWPHLGKQCKFSNCTICQKRHNSSTS